MWPVGPYCGLCVPPGCTVLAERLRAHHLLCTALYQGKGYSGDFESNMDRIASRVCREEDLVLCLLDSPDNICEECPNLTAEGCRLDDNSVVVTDRRLLDLLGQSSGNCMTVGQCRRLLRRKITSEIFQELCGECTWKKKGLCSYERLKIQLDR